MYIYLFSFSYTPKNRYLHFHTYICHIYSHYTYIYIRVYLQRYVYIYIHIYIYTFNWVQRPRQTFDQAACVIPASIVIALPLPVCVRPKKLPVLVCLEGWGYTLFWECWFSLWSILHNQQQQHPAWRDAAKLNVRHNGGWGDMMQHNESKAFWQQVSFMTLGPV